MFSFFRNGGHIVALQTYSLNDMHIVIGDVFKFFCYNGLLFQFPDFIEQVDQHPVDRFPCAQPFSPALQIDLLLFPQNAAEKHILTFF